MHPFDLACSQFAHGDFERAIETIETQDVADRSTEKSVLLLADCLHRLNRLDQALHVVSEWLEKNPDSYEALIRSAVLTRRTEGTALALQVARRAIEIRPDRAAAHSIAGMCHLEQHELDCAIRSFRTALDLAPDVAEHERSLGQAYAEKRERSLAEHHFKRAIELDPRSVQHRLSLASEYLRYNSFENTLRTLTEALQQFPDSMQVHLSLATAYVEAGKPEQAEAHYKRATELSPSSKALYATWLVTQGKISQADAIYERFIQNPSTRGLGYYGLMQSFKVTETDRYFVKQMESALDSQIPPQGRLELHHAIAKAYEQLGQYAEAIGHYDQANNLGDALHGLRRSDDPEHFRRQHDRITDFCERWPESPGAANPSETPIFIIGMVRSGTTLLDQILSSHPEIGSAGEMRYWIEETLSRVATGSTQDLCASADEYLADLKFIAGGSKRITDKMPLNFTVAGIIHRALPAARFVHLRRNPVDTCLSIYTTHYEKGPEFAYRKSKIVSYYREYERLMSYWRETLPAESLFELDYEDLVADRENVVRSLLGFLGLPWDDACLHHERNTRLINTPSRWDARRPIYNSSVGRSEKFGPWLGEFADLGEERTGSNLAGSCMIR